jgi:hypothetical protein
MRDKETLMFLFLFLFLFLRREARPDAAYWPGRWSLAALDAVAWPAAWVIGARFLPSKGGIAGAFLVAFCTIAAVHRLRLALRANHRYYFSTWRWGRIGLALLLFAYALKLAAIA